MTKRGKFSKTIDAMEILAEERSCYTLLAFIAIKMELHWGSNPIEKGRKNLPIWTSSKDSPRDGENFTQNS